MRIVISTLIAICVFMVSSCSSEKSTKEDTSTPKTGVPTGQEGVTRDSLYQAFDKRIESLENKSQNLAGDVQRAQETINDLAKFDIYAKIGLILGGIAALLSIVSIIALVKGRKHEQGKSQKPVMETRPYANSQTNTRLAKLEKLEKDSLKLEKTIQDLTKRIEALSLVTSPRTQPVVPKVEKPEPTKVGYAGLNQDVYFMEILSSNQDGCVYKIEFKSESKGEFDLISLNKIKSMNGWKDVVETEGDCMLEKATSYSVVSKGVCERIPNGKVWKVVSKLKIRLKK